MENDNPSPRPDEIRLACIDCDRDDFDGVAEIPSDWDEVHYQGDPVLDQSVHRWWTHLGQCPECMKAEAEQG